MAKKFTWGEALDYTLKTKWQGKAGLKTNVINTGHFTSFAGRSFPVERINQVQMDLFATYLRDERDLQDSTINRCITAIGTVINCCAIGRDAGEDDAAIDGLDDSPRVLILRGGVGDSKLLGCSIIPPNNPISSSLQSALAGLWWIRRFCTDSGS